MSEIAQWEKPKLSLSQIINMSVGFFGIQFGWDLQRANMGPIYEHLHANADDIPLLFPTQLFLLIFQIPLRHHLFLF